ncbi:TVP38/TMEM64 family protein [Mangrovibacillus cuniculi]|uniref:TVP38/TMEM64 family protein n=1 Tax=Mangrovibacillus cuniculi TaxID=2593652 RepID=UPI0030843CB8
MSELFTLDKLLELIGEYRSLGPIVAIVLPFLEAFLPFLPLIIFVTVNVNAFGLLWGFIFSWIGSVLGACVVFLLIRRYGHTRLLRWLTSKKTIQRLTVWVEQKGFGPLFVILCFPFTPSAVVNVVAGLSRIKFITFTFAVMLGKLVMIFTLSYIGYDIASLVKQPIRTAILLVIIALLWLVGKQVEKRLMVVQTKVGQREKGNE